MSCKRHIRVAAALLLFAIPLLCGCGDSERREREATVVELSGPGEESDQEGSTAEAMRRVLEADETLSKRYIQVRYQDPASWLEGHLKYARKMGAISLVGTPRAFSESFVRHQAAWAAYVAHLETAPSEALDAIMDPERRRRLAGNEAVRRAALLNGEISTTWTEVEMTASSRGIGDGPSLDAPPPPVGSADRLFAPRR